MDRLLLSFVLAVVMSGCGSALIAPPRVWLGNSDSQSIVDDNNRAMKCSNEDFNGMVCVTLEDYHYILQGLEYGCSPWERRSNLQYKQNHE